MKQLIDRNHLENNIRGVKRKDAGEQTMKAIELDGFRKTLKARQAELSDGRYNREALAIEPSADELDRIQPAQERDFAMGGAASQVHTVVRNQSRPGAYG